ncbi:class I SAM-dependent methyltransferase [Saccharolobus solfataricus]|uniref:Class I SAM-dependent methyltransferase n=1 Tax=Saccharolobus solfataricus TaxID=2287 RepID=A0A0E3MET3_SACSO|nr:class I SAM-dependent methyltransferase [Saccharolobus solfataricus]AKA75069.1 class I SAM-dependent methyltransferase [Saccharolobus solfataricus]AKA77763.1 class I SAM-dependent methyltransferase [Saccharolobus solfataricus]AKA80456.1 class I SAM-dependent methyltransferase [Saccharolobus solfataricus]AZF69519.1 class I SAM-dependent methyltransferase [Saccharolobus solfataricus]AZF72139.1 class I SAM-dependent methyltransferase [Saccharolobus solfataricus]
MYRRKPNPYARLIEGDRVVDVGCGSGQNCGQFKGRLAICLDLSLNQLKQARNKECENLVQADMEYLPFRDLSVTSLVYIASLHHLRDPSRALEEAYRVLINGGEILVTVWLVQLRFLFLRRYIIKRSFINGKEIRRFYRLYYPWELRRIMESRGFVTKMCKLYRVNSLLPNNLLYYGIKSTS